MSKKTERTRKRPEIQDVQQRKEGSRGTLRVRAWRDPLGDMC